MRPSLPPQIAHELREALSECTSARGLTDGVRSTIVTLCSLAKADSWTPEQMVVAVKDACFSSSEFSNQHSSSEREAIVAKVVTASIREYYRTAPA